VLCFLASRTGRTGGTANSDEVEKSAGNGKRNKVELRGGGGGLVQRFCKKLDATRGSSVTRIPERNDRSGGIKGVKGLKAEKGVGAGVGAGGGEVY